MKTYNRKNKIFKFFKSNNKGLIIINKKMKQKKHILSDLRLIFFNIIKNLFYYINIKN
jgi:hypothetical protein